MAFLATGSVVCAGTPTATTYTADDLFIGFHKTGNASDYLVKIGQASTFTSTQTLSLGDIASDLKAVFGDSWATDSTIKWGVVGTTKLLAVGSDPAHTIYASKQGNASTTTPWNTGSSSTLSTGDAKIAGMTSAYNGKLSTANSSVGLIQNSIDTAINGAYASYQPGGANATAAASGLSFALFNPTIEASSTSGITDSSATLAVYRLVPSAIIAPATAVGTFSIDSSGTVTFTVATISAFNTWATSHSLSGAKALPTANPSGDGVQNMVKFVLGADPTTGVAQDMPTAVISGANYVYSFPFNSNSTAEYTTAVQYSTDLVTWTTASGGSLSGSTYTYTIPRGGASKFFTRLCVSPK